MDTSKDRQAFVIETLLSTVKVSFRDITLKPFEVCLKPVKFENNYNAPGRRIRELRAIWDHDEIGLEQNPEKPFRFWGINEYGKIILVSVTVTQIRGSHFRPTVYDSQEISARQLLEHVSWLKIFAVLEAVVQEQQRKFRERLAMMDWLATNTLAARYSLIGGQ